VGQSGSGKSTIANHLPFYDVQEGTTIDNTNIKDMNLQSQA
jgi:ABC-type multidrug transport system fused ATPase/permease subunit